MMWKTGKSKNVYTCSQRKILQFVKAINSLDKEAQMDQNILVSDYILNWEG